MGWSIINIIVFIIYILYNIVTAVVIDVETQEKMWYIITSISGIIISIIALIINGNMYKNWFQIIMYMIFISAGYGLSAGYISTIIEKKDDIAAVNYKSKILFSSIFFTFVGFASFGLNKYLGESCDYSKELLCDFNTILILITSNLVIYKCINLLKLHGNNWIWKKTDNKSESADIGIILFLCLWQFYIYFLIDGFRGGMLRNVSLKTATKDKSISEIFSGFSIFIILMLLIFSFITNDKCKEWNKPEDINYVNNIKEISYNMIMNTIISIIIIFILKDNIES